MMRRLRLMFKVLVCVVFNKTLIMSVEEKDGVSFVVSGDISGESALYLFDGTLSGMDNFKSNLVDVMLDDGMSKLADSFLEDWNKVRIKHGL